MKSGDSAADRGSGSRWLEDGGAEYLPGRRVCWPPPPPARSALGAPARKSLASGSGFSPGGKMKRPIQFENRLCFHGDKEVWMFKAPGAGVFGIPNRSKTKRREPREEKTPAVGRRGERKTREEAPGFHPSAFFFWSLRD